MRVPFRIKYRNYPNSPELTNKSIRVATLTSPIYGVMLGVIPGIASPVIFPSSLTLPLVLMFVGIVAGPLLLRAYRKKKFAQYDAEYQRLVQAQQK